MDVWLFDTTLRDGGIGTSEVAHVLATQCLLQRPSKNLAVDVSGRLRAGVTAKDLILAVIARLGVGGATGHVIEYRGHAVRALSMEERMTVCNMSIEAGARAGMIAPDEVTFRARLGRSALAREGAALHGPHPRTTAARPSSATTRSRTACCRSRSTRARTAGSPAPPARRSPWTSKSSASLLPTERARRSRSSRSRVIAC